MRQNIHIPSASQPRLFSSRASGRLTRLMACAAAACFAYGAIAPAGANTPVRAAAQTKKDKKKDKTPAPPKSTTPAAPVRTVLIFPPETKGGVSDQIADAITDVVQSRLNLSGKYKTVLLLPSAPIIRRGLLDNSLTKEEVDKPYATDARIKKFTELTSHDLAFVVSIIDYQYDKATNKVSMVLSAKMVDYTGSAPRGTNRNGESPDKPSAKATEYDLAAALARDLTEKMVSDLLAPPKKSE